MASGDASESAALGQLLRAPNKDVVFAFFGACFRHRHNLSGVRVARRGA